MKCTDFRKELDSIHNRELEELASALKVHGGEYCFKGSVGPHLIEPRVVIEYDMGVAEFAVFKMRLSDAGLPLLIGKVFGDDESWSDEVEANSAMVGYISKLIELMSEPLI